MRGMAGQALRMVLHFDWVFFARSTAQILGKRGILLPEKSQGKVLRATVVALWILKERVERFNKLAWKLEEINFFPQNMEAAK